MFLYAEQRNEHNHLVTHQRSWWIINWNYWKIKKYKWHASGYISINLETIRWSQDRSILLFIPLDDSFICSIVPNVWCNSSLVIDIFKTKSYLIYEFHCNSYSFCKEGYSNEFRIHYGTLTTSKSKILIGHKWNYSNE